MPLEHIVFTLPDALTSIQILINKGSGKSDPSVDTHCLLKAGLVILGYANEQVMHQPAQDRPVETYAFKDATAEGLPLTAFQIHLETLKKAEARLTSKVVTSYDVSGAVDPIWWSLLDAVPDLVRELINRYFK